MAKLQVKVSAEDHARGEASAKVTLVEYGDFQCPHCAMAHAIVSKIEKHYGDRLRFVYRNFPLTEIHPLAEPAAEAAEYAGSKGKYWEMYDAIFAHQRSLSEKMLRTTAESVGLDGEEAASAVAPESRTACAVWSSSVAYTLSFAWSRSVSATTSASGAARVPGADGASSRSSVAPSLTSTRIAPGPAEAGTVTPIRTTRAASAYGRSTASTSTVSPALASVRLSRAESSTATLRCPIASRCSVTPCWEPLPRFA